MKKANILVVWVLMLAVCVACWYGLSVWTDNNLEFWLSYSKGHHVDVNNTLSVIVTLILNGLTLPLNIISELVKLAVS